MPTSISEPMNAVSPNARCVSHSDAMMPISANGTAIMMTSGSRNDSNCEASSM